MSVEVGQAPQATLVGLIDRHYGHLANARR
jgi:hypothetical protein